MVITAAERAAMQTTQESHMGDTCVIQSHSATQDAYGQESSTYTDGASIPCGFSYAPMGVAPEIERPTGTVMTIDAMVRLRIEDGEDVSPTDRVKLTHRFGEALSTPQVYEVTGNPRVGPSGIVLQLQRVTL